VSARTPCIHELKDCTNSSGVRLCPVAARLDEHPTVASQWEEADAEHSPPSSGSLLLYGSSVLRLWQDAAGYWEPLPTLNRAFGGARTWEAVLHFPYSVVKYKPRVVILYCGSNDVNYHVSRGTPQEDAVAEVVGNIELILRASSYIKAQVLVLSVIKAPQKRLQLSHSSLVDGVNAALEALCEEAEHAEYVDLNPVLEDEAGHPLDTIYKPDGLHYKPEAYKRFHDALRAPVSRRWEMAKDQQQ
jgi:lysophospholipase L1-like esterase